MNAPAPSVIPAGTTRSPQVLAERRPPLPVARLLGLVGSAGLTVWTGLSCFVC